MTIVELQPANLRKDQCYVVTDAAGDSDCSTGAGTILNICCSNGTSYFAVGDGAGAGSYDLNFAGDSGAGVITDAETFTLTGGNGIVTTAAVNDLNIVLDLNATLDGVGSASNLSGLEFTATAEVALLQGCADQEVLKWEDTGATWDCSPDASGSSNSFETWDAPAGTDPVADSATDTMNVTQGIGILVTGTAASDTLDFDFDYSSSISTDPALGAEECVFSTDGSGSSGAIICEGTVADAFEFLIQFPNVTGADKQDSFVLLVETQLLQNKSLNSTNAISAGAYVAGSIDGDDINTTLAGDGLILTVAAPDTLDIDLNVTLDGVGATSNLSGMEFTATSELALLQGCGDTQVLKWVDAGATWDCAADADTDTNLSQEQVEDFAGNMVANATGTHTGIAITYQDATGDMDFIVDHDGGINFVADEHIAHSGVVITAGTGLTGGGDITVSRTIDAAGGDGIIANANDLAVDLNATVDGLGATSNLSGMEFTATAELALLQGCADTEVLSWTEAGSTWGCAAAGAAAHDILSATHTDSLAAAVSRGSTIIGNSSPAWSELVVGAANLVHYLNNATDVFWGDSDSALFILAQTTVPGVDGGIIIDTNADNTNVIDDVLMFQSGSIDYNIPSLRTFPTSNAHVIALNTTTDQYVWKPLVSGNGISVAGGATNITINMVTEGVNAIHDSTVPTTAENSMGIDTTGDGVNILHDVLSFRSDSENFFIPAAREYPTVDNSCLVLNATNDDWEWSSTSCIAGGGTVDSIQGDGDVATTGAILSIDGTATGIDTSVSGDTMTVALDLSEVSSGGELGGTMDAPTVDATHSGSAHHSVFSPNADPGVDHSALAGGDGITETGGVIATASSEENFLTSGALTCGAGTAGKMQTHTTALQYCDNTATPILRFAAYGGSGGLITDFSNAADLNAGGTVNATHSGTAHHSVFTPNADPGVDHSGLSGDNGITEVAGALSIDLNATLDGVGLTSSLSGMEFTATSELALIQGCANNEILKWTDASATWGCSADATGGGGANSFETWNTPAGTNPVADSATDTINITDGLGLVITGTAASDTADWSFDYSLTLAGNPALGVDECVFSSDGTGGVLLCEGNVADTIEGLLVWPVATSDKTLTLPNATDTLVARATTDTLMNKTLDSSNVVQAGAYDAASIDGDDVNSNIAGDGLILTADAPDTLDIDLNATLDGVGATSNLSGMEFTATAELALLQGCADNQVLKWEDTGATWDCAADADTQLTTEAVEDIAGALVANATGTHTGIAITYQDATGDMDFIVDHDGGINFVADEHVAHTGVVITAGTGLTGGGDISVSRTIDAAGGDGIIANANDLAVDLNATLDGVGATTNLSGMEFTATAELALLQGCADNEILKWANAGATWDCAADADTGGSTTWDAIGDPAGNGAIAFADTAQTMDWDTPATATARDAFTFTFAHDASTDATTQRGVVITRTATAGLQALERLLVIENLDTDGPVNTALEFVSAAGTIGIAVDASDPQIVTSLAVGSNQITTTASILVAAELDRLDGLVGIIVTDGTAVTDVEGAGLLISGAVLRVDSLQANFLRVSTSSAASDGALVIDSNGDAVNILNDVLVFQSGGEDFFVPAPREYPTVDGQVLKFNATNDDWEWGTDNDTQLTQEQVEDFAGALVANATGTHTGIAITYQDGTADMDFIVDHDGGINFVADEHVAHTGVVITAGTGLTGGGDISVSRTIDAAGGDGIIANANDLAVDLNATLDGVGATSNLSGMEFTATAELALLQGCANNEILKWVDAGATWDCAADADTGGAPALSAITDPVGDVGFIFDDGEEITWTMTSTGAVGTDVFHIDFDQPDDADATDDIDVWQITLSLESGDVGDTIRAMKIVLNDGVANTVLDAGWQIINDETTAGTIIDAIRVLSPGVDGGIIDAIDASAANIDNALNMGANNIVTGSATISGGEMNILDGGILITELTTGTKANLESILSDVTDLAEADGDIFTGVHDFGGATSLEIVNAAAPVVDTLGEIAVDTTDVPVTDGVAQLIYHDGGEVVMIPGVKHACFDIADLVAGDDDFAIWSPPYAVTIRGGYCYCNGTCTVAGTVHFEKNRAGVITQIGGASTTGDVACSNSSSATEALTDLTSGTLTLQSFDQFRFDTITAPTATNNMNICWTYTADRQ